MIPTDLLFKKWRAFSVPDEILHEQLLIESRYTDAVATATNLKRIMSRSLRANMTEKQEDEIRERIAAAIANVAANDPTGQNAYLPWISKTVRAELKSKFTDLERRTQTALTQSPTDMIQDYLPSFLESIEVRLGRLANFEANPQRSLKSFHNLRERNILPTIEAFPSFDMLSIALDQGFRELRRRETEEKLSREADDSADVLIDDDEVQMVRPLNTAASCKYGQGTMWCTSATTSQNYFDSYTGQGKAFYYVTFKNLLPDDDQRQLALVYSNTDRYDAYEPSEVYDRPDDEVGTEAVYEAAFRNHIAKPLRQLPFYRDLMSKSKGEIKILETEAKSLAKHLRKLRGGEGAFDFSPYPWLSLGEYERQQHHVSAREREQAMIDQGRQDELDMEQRLFDLESEIQDKKKGMQEEIKDLIDSTEEVLRQGWTDAGGGDETEALGPLLKELAKGFGIQVKGEEAIDADAMDDTEGIETIEELEELLREVTNEQVGELFADAHANLEDNPAGPSPEDFDKILSQYDFKYVYVNEPEDYSGEGNYSWSAGASIDFDNMFEGDEWASDDDHYIADVAHRILDDHYIYPSETRLETYGGAHELYMDFTPDYDEDTALAGFESFCSRMSDYDDALDKITEADWREAFTEADILTGESTKEVVESFNQLNLEHFQVDVEANEIEIATSLLPTIAIPKWVNETPDPKAVLRDIFAYIATRHSSGGRYINKTFIEKMHAFIQRELQFMLAQSTIPGIGGSPDFGEDEPLEQMAAQFAPGAINVSLFPQHGFEDNAMHSAFDTTRAQWAAMTPQERATHSFGAPDVAQAPYWFQIEINMGKDGTDESDIPILRNLAQYLDQDRVHKWISSYLEKTINDLLSEVDYEEHIIAAKNPDDIARERESEDIAAQGRADLDKWLQDRKDRRASAATAPPTTVQTGESIPGVFGEPEDLSESLIFEVDKLLRSL